MTSERSRPGRPRGAWRDLDRVSALRFASVYKGFDDLADFEREIGLLTKN